MTIINENKQSEGGVTFDSIRGWFEIAGYASRIIQRGMGASHSDDGKTEGVDDARRPVK